MPVAWSLRRRSRRAGEPLLILVDGDAAVLPPDVGRGIVIQVACLPWLPEVLLCPLLVRFQKLCESQKS